MGARGEVFSVNRSSLIQIHRCSISKFPAAPGSWRPFALPGVLSASPNLWLLRTGGGLLAITAGALAFSRPSIIAGDLKRDCARLPGRPRAKFQALAENAQDAIVSVDNRGNIIYYNRAAQRTFGYEVSEVVGQPLTLLIPDRVRDQPLQEVTRFIAEGEAHVVGKVIDVMGRKKAALNFRWSFPLAPGRLRRESLSRGFFATSQSARK